MNEQHQSYIDRYIRAKKRTEVTPKCLFGAPCRAETDRFLLQHELEQMKETREVYEKYDLSEIPEGDEKDNLFPEFERQDDKADEISVRFQPKVVTELDSPPSGSLFTPIEKVGSTGAVGSGETKLTGMYMVGTLRGVRFDVFVYTYRLQWLLVGVEKLPSYKEILRAAKHIFRDGISKW